MESRTKEAYRHLLYVALLTIRADCQSRGRESMSPFVWRRQYRRSRIAGATADWLHNLADRAVADFDGFEEKRFWEEHSHLCSRFPGQRLERYREIFDQFLAGKLHIVL